MPRLSSAPQNLGESMKPLFALLTALLLAGCAATSLTNQWKNPDATGAQVRKVLVVGVSDYPSIRRVFEDEFVAQLRGVGLAAEPSYRFIAHDGQVDAATLANAADEAGAQATLVTRLVRVEQVTDFMPAPYWSAWPWIGYAGWYPAVGGGIVVGPTPYQYNVVVAETSLYLQPAGKLLWSGMTRTVAPQDVGRDTQRFAKLIIDSLNKQGIL
jgi:hypothetical protein